MKKSLLVLLQAHSNAPSDPVASASIAAERATRHAFEAAECARLAGVAEDDGAEALRAGSRARDAARCSRSAASDDERQSYCRLAWAAAADAQEAEERVRSAIVESLIAG